MMLVLKMYVYTQKDLLKYTQDSNISFILGHAYTITKVVPEYGLIRIRNPWGRAEWTGAWSDHSTKWKKVSPEEKAKYNLVIEDDGEFYISFKDFHQIFQTLTICNISHLDAGLAWNEEKIFGSWRRNVSAGKQINFFLFWGRR